MVKSEMSARLSEFKALRAEILRRISGQMTIFAFTVSASAVLLGFIFVQGNFALILALPAFFFISELLYIKSLESVVKIALYIKNEIEPKVPGLGWETYQAREKGKKGIIIGRGFQHIFHIIFIMPIIGSIAAYVLLTVVHIIDLPMQLHYLGIAVSTFYVVLSVLSVYWLKRLNQVAPHPVS